MFSVSADHTLRVWGDGPVAPLRRTYCARTRFHALAFSPDGKRLAVACDNGVVQVLEWAQDRVPPIELRHDSPVRTLAWSDDGATLWTGVAGAPATGGETSKHAAIVQWRVADGRTLRTIPQSAPIEGLVLGRGGHFLAASSGDSTVRVYALAPD
ncbi:MAG TPA: hypothetical protein PLV92_29100, partial [Pirellulaceae bacterium]|nr:hypothetical protein [Pirellulaceae bacterium]